MKVRLVSAAVLAGALALSTVGAEAAPPKTLDGKKVKVLTLNASGGLQSNDKDNASLTSVDRADCAAPRCARLPFVYKPAKGVKGDLMATVTWTNPASDIDLYIGEVLKDGSTVTVDSCGGFGNTSEKVFVPAGVLRSGRTYVLVVDWYRSLNETAKAKVELGGSTVKTTVPKQYDGQLPGTVFKVNCGL
jgi:hypothetical protein